VKLVWSVSGTTPLGRKPGFIDRQKLKYAAKFSKRADGIVYTSEAAASAHRRVGFPEEGHTVIPLGVDPTRFKPDFAARRKLREQFGLGPDAFVIGMMAPFQPEYDHSTFFKAIGELIKTNPHIAVLLAGHGVQKGNAPLMALVGGGTLGTRTQLLGEWSDVAAFFNACDLACSSALTDNARMSLVIAMLCGVPCIATGMGAQGEVIGQFGVAVEPGSPAALIRGITRVLQLTPEKRVFMAQGARKHALANFVSIRSLQKYLQFYYDLVGRKLIAATAVPTPEIDATIPMPSAEEQAAAKAAPKPKTNRTVDMYELRDPDSLESRDVPTPEERAASRAGEADVLNIFESTMAKQAASSTSPMSERARGVADELEDLLAPELLSSGAEAKPVTPIPVTPSPVTPIADVAPAPIAPTTEAVVKPVVASVPAQPQTLELAKDEPLTRKDPEAATSSKVAPAPALSKTVDSPKIELTLADTMSLSVQISSAQFSSNQFSSDQFSSTSMTGTLEIPPDLIFMTAATTSAPKPVSAPAAPTVAAVPEIASVAASPTFVAVPEVVVPSAALPTIAAMPAADVLANITADSSTVPAIAVDALLSSAMELSVTPPEAVAVKESIQLDLLGEPIERVAG
jgi:hypothetical protein